MDELFLEEAPVKSILVGNYKNLNQKGKITSEEKAPSQQFIIDTPIFEHLLNQASVGKRLSFQSSMESVTNLYHGHGHAWLFTSEIH